MKKLIFGALIAAGLMFAGGTVYAQPTFDIPGAPSESDVQMDEVLGMQICAVDNYGNVYNLTVSGGNISGTMDSPYCGHYGCVTGTYSGLSFVMHMGCPSNSSCIGFTYTGVVNPQTKTASGTWVNDGNQGSGSFTMSLCR
ncbi:MAG: hypothetical protein A2W74_01770 [Planctomycetes bacterium RIFCSPLOWO2_12_38_17]|nr:MAG: hypothetical protein A2W74_01770 [Planctomycetes bacterium RIFCSPLOWO2_12_38_17]